MPLYEYHCDSCQKDFTLLQSTKVDQNETRCEECGSEDVRRNLSTFASKIQGEPTMRGKPATIDDYPGKKIPNLPIPRLRSEL